MELDNIFVRENKTKPSLEISDKSNPSRNHKTIFFKNKKCRTIVKPAPNQEIRVPKCVLSVTLYQVERL
jgi:hypothetical protein